MFRPDVRSIEKLIARLNQSISARKDEENARCLLDEAFEYLENLSNIDQSALAPMQIDRLFSRAKHSEKSMKIALELINQRKDTILFFKGKQNCFSELSQTFKSTSSSFVKSKIAEIFSNIFSCPMWPILSLNGMDEIVAKICRNVMHDVSNSNWLNSLKNLVKPESDSVENIISEGKSRAERVDGLPDILMKLFLESEKFRTENFSNAIGWLADDSPDGGIDRILKNMTEKLPNHKKLMKTVINEWSIGGKLSTGAKNFDNFSKFIWWTRRFISGDEKIVLQNILDLIVLDNPDHLCDRIGQKLIHFIPIVLASGHDASEILQKVFGNEKYENCRKKLLLDESLRESELCWKYFEVSEILSSNIKISDELFEFILSKEITESQAQELLSRISSSESDQIFKIIEQFPGLIGRLTAAQQLKIAKSSNGSKLLNKALQGNQTINPVVLSELVDSPEIEKSLKWDVISKYDFDLENFYPLELYELLKFKGFLTDKTSRKIISCLDFSSELSEIMISDSPNMSEEFRSLLMVDDRFRTSELPKMKTPSLKVFYNLIKIDQFCALTENWEKSQILDACLENLVCLESFVILEKVICEESAPQVVEKLFSQRKQLFTSISYFEETKDALGSLMIKISSVLPEKEINLDFPRLILATYSATLSQADRKIFDAFRKISSRLDISELRPFLFGQAAQENLENENSDSEKRLNQNESRLFISEINKDLVRGTMRNFPYFLKFQDNPKDDLSAPGIYDIRFLLMALCDCTRSSASIDTVQLIKSGALSLAFLSSCLIDDELRSIGLETISRIREHAFLFRWGNFNLVPALFHLFDLVNDPEKPLDGIAAQFFARAAILLVKPEHEFYQPVMAGIVHMAEWSNCVPDFLDYFWSTLDQRGKRLWLMDLIHDGINRREDLKALNYYHAIDFILASAFGSGKEHYLRYYYQGFTLIFFNL